MSHQARPRRVVSDSRGRTASPEVSEAQALLARARRLDGNALGQLHDLYYPQVYRYVHFRLSDAPACEKISGQVFLRFLDALDRRRAPQQDLLGWLLQEAAVLVDEQLRAGRKRAGGGNFKLPWRKASPVAEAALEEQNPLEPAQAGQQIWTVLQRLPRAQQHWLALRFALGLSLEQAAGMIHKSGEAAKRLQWRSLAALQKALEGER